MFTHRQHTLGGSFGPAARQRSGGEAASGLVRPTSLAFDRWCLGAFVRSLAGVPMRCVLWDGTTLAASDAPIARVAIHDRLTLVQLLWNPDLALGEAYTDGRLDIDGDLVGLLTAIARTFESRLRVQKPALRRQGAPNTDRARRNARYHYDVGNDFYKLWLDEQLVYTCAYFTSPEASLDAAQQAKLELVARKLALEPGERVFEAGCGWGALALHLARVHGVTVRAWNVSSEQVAWARRRASDAGLDRRVEFIEGDYRTIDGTCDAFVSVGMLEHVGAQHFQTLGALMDRCLHRTHGRGLLHFIGRNAPTPMSRWINRYIFPGAYIPSLREALEGVLEPYRFSVVDVENLRLHYALTLRHWLERFERQSPQVAARFGDTFTRMWRLYLAEAQAGFSGGLLQLFQVVFARGQHDGLPWTRAAIYDPSGPK